MHGRDTVAVARQKAQQIQKQESVPAVEIRRRTSPWGLQKPPGARSKVWNHAFKYIKCPTKTVNSWEHHAICSICLKDDISNATVKLGYNDSTTPLVDHFMLHHKEVWECFHTENQKKIPFNSRDASGRSTRSSPLRTPTVPQHRLADEKRKSMRRLFPESDGQGGASSAAAKRGSSSITGGGESSSPALTMRTFFPPQDAPAAACTDSA